jgi:Secretion system C-terminal sorting domain
MKKTTILVWGVLIVCAFILSSYREGAALHAGWDCTGAETGLSNPAGCSNGGCHGNSATTGIVLSIEIDSAGIPVTSYKADSSYTIKFRGVNTTVASLPKFGFQIGAITGSTAVTTPTNAGTWQQTGLPTNVHFSGPQANNYVLNIVEQGSPLSPDSLTGGVGTVYGESIGWTAPAAGTGTVSFWLVLNAVNNDGNASNADKWNTIHVALTEDTASIPAAIHTTDDAIDARVFPNPSTDLISISLNNAPAGNYTINAFDATSQKVYGTALEVSGAFTHATINTSSWASGTYILQITNGTLQKAIKVVKP